jgi:hypothetical protein
MASSTRGDRLPAYLLAYLLWAVVGVLGLVALARLREAALHLVVVARWSPWVMGFVDKSALILLGLAWLILILFCEAYFRAGVKRGNLLRRFGTIAGAEVTVALASYLFTLVRL